MILKRKNSGKIGPLQARERSSHGSAQSAKQPEPEVEQVVCPLRKTNLPDDTISNDAISYDAILEGMDELTTDDVVDEEEEQTVENGQDRKSMASKSPHWTSGRSERIQEVMVRAPK